MIPFDDPRVVRVEGRGMVTRIDTEGDTLRITRAKYTLGEVATGAGMVGFILGVVVTLLVGAS